MQKSCKLFSATDKNLHQKLCKLEKRHGTTQTVWLINQLESGCIAGSVVAIVPTPPTQLWEPFLVVNESYITFWRGIPQAKLFGLSPKNFFTLNLPTLKKTHTITDSACIHW